MSDTDAALRSYYAIEAHLGGSWVALARDAIVGDVEGEIQGGGSSDNGMASAADSSIDFGFSVLMSELPSVPAGMPVRISYRITYPSIGDRTARSAVGTTTGVADDDSVDQAWAIRCRGIQELINGVRAYSPMFVRRPAARKTTTSSPVLASDPACSPIEWLLLKAGGWPAARDYENAGALFYYDLDQSILAPDYMWFAGEKGYDELLNLVKAVGGQIYVRADGVLVYRQPLNFGDQLAEWTYTDYGSPNYASKRALVGGGGIKYRRSDRKVAAEVRCSSVARRLYEVQDLLEYTEHQTFAAGETRTIELELDQPIAAIETAAGVIDVVLGMAAPQLIADALIIGDGANQRVAQGSAGYTHTMSVTAQRIFLTITNTLGRPFVLYKAVIRGQPLGKAATFSVSAGSADPADAERTLTLDDNPLIQRRSQAEALCKMYLAFYGPMPSGEPRPTYSLRDCIYNPELDIGDAIYLVSNRKAALLTPVRCVVVNIKHSRTGHLMDIDAVPVEDLPKQSDFYLIGSTNYSGQTKRIGW